MENKYKLRINHLEDNIEEYKKENKELNKTIKITTDKLEKEHNSKINLLNTEINNLKEQNKSIKII